MPSAYRTPALTGRVHRETGHIREMRLASVLGNMALAGVFLERGGRFVGTEENKAAQRRIIDELINGKDLDLADDLFSEGHALYPESSGVGRGPEGMKRAFAGLHEEFPDIRVEIEDILAEGDMVAVRLTFRGTHAPTGEKAAWPETVFARFSEGKAVESWEVTDTGRGWDSPPW